MLMHAVIYHRAYLMPARAQCSWLNTSHTEQASNLLIVNHILNNSKLILSTINTTIIWKSLILRQKPICQLFFCQQSFSQSNISNKIPMQRYCIITLQGMHISWSTGLCQKPKSKQAILCYDTRHTNHTRRNNFIPVHIQKYAYIECWYHTMNS